MKTPKWALLICLLGVSARADTMQRGMDLTLWNDSTTGLNDSLDKFKADGGTNVCINVWWFQDNINSTTIAPNYNLYSAHDDTVRAAIDAAQTRGLTVSLKPLVDLSNDSNHWRGQITGGNSWFTGSQGYRAFLDHFADIAQQRSVSLLVVGTELGGTAGQESNWRAAVSDVKGRFSGKLTYAASSGDPAVSEPVNWWDALDYIGIDAYYPLTTQDNPPLAALVSAWAGRAAQIEAWRNGLAANQQKPILFTEVGYCSQTGTNKAPYSWTVSSTANQTEQARCYEALLSQLWGAKPWLAGTYWWNWEVAAHPDDPLGYTPQDKLAEGILKSYYAAPGSNPTMSWGATGDNSWSNVANWSPGNVPDINRDVAVFGAKGTLANPLLAAGTTVRQLTFTGGGWTISGSGTLRIEGPDGFLVHCGTAGLGTNTIGCPLAVGNWSRFLVASGNALVANAAVAGFDDSQVYLESWSSSGGTLKLAAPSGGNAPWWVVRSGKLVLANDNAVDGSRGLMLGDYYAGTAAILTEGPRTLTKNIAIGMTSPWVSVPQAAFDGTIGGSTDDNTTFSGSITMSGQGDAGEYAGIKLTSMTTGSRAVTFAGTISGSKSVTKVGPGRVILSGSNNFTGGTSVLAGTLGIATADSLPTGGNLTIASGGHMVLASGLNHAISLGGLTIASRAGVGQAPSPDSGAAPVGQGAASSAAPTAEPGTLALLAAGLTAVLVVAKRKRTAPMMIKRLASFQLASQSPFRMARVGWEDAHQRGALVGKSHQAIAS